MVIPQPMSQKNPDFEPLSLIYRQNTGLRALAVGLMPSNPPGGGFGDLVVFGRFGVKNDPKKGFQMCLGILWGGIYVSGWFRRILGPPGPIFGPCVRLVGA
jgi:hypothetical protein